MLLRVVLLSFAALALADTISFTGIPGYSDLTYCVRGCLNDLASEEGCSTNACFCRQDHFNSGLTSFKNCVSGPGTGCGGDALDLQSGETIAVAYCASVGSTVTASSIGEDKSQLKHLLIYPDIPASLTSSSSSSSRSTSNLSVISRF